jgi:hypothetical protein
VSIACFRKKRKLNNQVQEDGITPSTEPKDWPWGQREFVVRDPDRYKPVFYLKLGLPSVSLIRAFFAVFNVFHEAYKYKRWQFFWLIKIIGNRFLGCPTDANVGIVEQPTLDGKCDWFIYFAETMDTIVRMFNQSLV